MSECNHDCTSCREKCDSRQQSAIQYKPLHENSRVNKVIGILSGKGGVGKSMVTCQLAVILNRLGYKVGILDADITGPSVPKAFTIAKGSVTHNDAIYPAVSPSGIQIISINLLLDSETTPVLWRGPVVSGLVQKFWSDVVWDVDYLLIDMPPGTGDVPLSVMQMIPLEGLVIVSTPQDLVAMIVEKSVNMAQITGTPILGLVENMSYIECPDCSKRIYPFGKSHIHRIASEHDLKVLGCIPLDEHFSELADCGKIEELSASWLDDAAALIANLS